MGTRTITITAVDESRSQNNVSTVSTVRPTNEWYAVAKIAGIKLCQAYRRQYGVDFISAMPTLDLTRELGYPPVVVWGTGTPCCEFLFVDDLADACLFVLEHISGELI